MKMNNIGYLIKEGVRSIFSHGLMSFASVCVTVACMIIVGSFSILMYNLNIMVTELNQTNEVICYVDSAYTDAEAKSVHSRINMIDNVFRAEYKSRETALEEFIEDHDNDAAFQGVDPQDLRHRIVVVLEDNSRMEETVALLEQVDGVAMIDAEFELAEGFTTISSVLGLVSTGIIVILLIVSLLIISNTVKLAMYDRKNEIAIMKMVGATNGFIRFPFMVQGFFLGIIGAALAFGVEWFLYDGLVNKIAEVDALGLFNFVPFNELLLPMVVVFGTAGLFVGIFGSISAIRKFMDV
ncbi:MAG: permease-like cell division protein FtsX [Oscillospiraceae bacterium]|nr:permease-like cell division protein FtsX [Oscillospiraceae bacterium]